MASTSIKPGKSVSGQKGTKPAKAVSTKNKKVGNTKTPALV